VKAGGSERDIRENLIGKSVAVEAFMIWQQPGRPMFSRYLLSSTVGVGLLVTYRRGDFRIRVSSNHSSSICVGGVKYMYMMFPDSYLTVPWPWLCL